MKRAISILLALAVLCLTTGASWHTVLTGIVSTGTTYSLQQTFGTDTSDAVTPTSASNRKYIGSAATPDANYTITRVELYLKRVDGGGAAADLVCEIRADNSGVPGTLLATSTNTIVSADVSTSYGWAAFNFTGLAVTNGTPVYLVVKGATTDAANYYTWRGGALATGDIERSSDGASWANISNRQCYARTYVSP